MDNYFENEWGGYNIVNAWDDGPDEFENEFEFGEDEVECPTKLNYKQQ